MSAAFVSFASAIREIAGGLGLEPTDQHVGIAEAILQTGEISLAEDGTATLDLFGEGPMIVTDAIAAQLGRMQLPPVAPPSPSPAERPGVLRVGNSTMTGRTDSFAELHRHFQAGQAADTARQVATWPNPWKGEINRTRQQIIMNTNPALAAKYKAEAGL